MTDTRMAQVEASTDRSLQDRLLPLIAVERAFRGVVLFAVGIALVTHPHAHWASDISRWAERLGLDPKGSVLKGVIEKISKIPANQDVIFGVAALAYSVLESAEAYGLWKRKRWGEWLTVVATSLLFIPEIWELTKSATLLKVGALLANAAIVAYLVWRLRREHEEPPAAADALNPSRP
jgi:uncharacterized membrane protein (DUF2068 family)